MITLPVLRFGRPYDSAEHLTVVDATDGTPLAQLGLANAALLRRDARRVPAVRAELTSLPTIERIRRSEAAADAFLHGTLPLGDTPVGPDAFVRLTSRATGLPEALVHANLAKLHHVLAHLGDVLAGLSRDLDLSVLDTGFLPGPRPVAYVPRATSLSAVLPSNSPGVHSLWLPAPALGAPVALKPGRTEPFVALRLIAALVQAGLPASAFAWYPTDHAGADALVTHHDHSLVFGGPTVAARYAHQPGVDVHGPGYSKVLLGPDTAAHWANHLDLLAASVASNGGRSCINASAILTPGPSLPLATALAERLAAHVPRPLDDPRATLAAVLPPATASALDQQLDRLLAEPGATELSRGPRLLHDGPLTYLRPTVVHLTRDDHPLAQSEHGFPFVTVRTVPADRLVASLGPTLALTALTDDPQLVHALLTAPHVDRLHLGPLPTHQPHWDQPHEGNLFEALWRRRAVARAPLVSA